MEKILLWALCLILTFGYEYISKKIKNKSSVKRPEAESQKPRSPYVSRPNPPGVMPSRHVRELTPSPLRVAREPLHSETTVARASRLRPVPDEGSCSLSEHHLHPEQNEMVEPSNPAPSIHSDGQSEERSAHYARWRQAVIDTQILERKF